MIIDALVAVRKYCRTLMGLPTVAGDDSPSKAFRWAEILAVPITLALITASIALVTARWERDSGQLELEAAYVGIATQILSTDVPQELLNPETDAGTMESAARRRSEKLLLREWAVDLLDATSPVPVGPDLRAVFEQGDALPLVATAARKEISVFSMRAGDCVSGDIAFGDVKRLIAVDCSTPHDYQIYREALVDPAIVTFDEELISSSAREVCRTSLASLVLPTDERDLRFNWLQPTLDSWNSANNPDRAITCLAYDQDGPLVDPLG